MARSERDREDLMREATALRRRGELRIPGRPEPLVAGYRDGGRWSVYFGSDPCYHFDADGRLRRAFVSGDLFRSQGTTLARLTRQRTPRETDLLRHDLTADELAAFLTTLRDDLESLRRSLVEQSADWLQTIPEGDSLAADLVESLNQALRASPPLAGRLAFR